MVNVLKTISHFLFPASCLSCQAAVNKHAALCAECLLAIMPITSRELLLTKCETMKIFALSAYRDPLKKLVLAKHNGVFSASKLLGILAAELLPLSSMPCDMLIPIPLFWTRYALRGFNQAELMGKEIAKKFNKPLYTALKRVKNTPFQSLLTAEERVHNVKRVFALKNNISLEGKHIVLIDDLMTTGATLMEAGKLILAHKPASVSAIVACRTL